MSEELDIRSLPVTDAAKLLKVAPKTIRAHIRRGLPRVGKRIDLIVYGAWLNQQAESAHTFATVIGLTLVSLVRLALGTGQSALSMMKTLAEVKATLVRVRTKEKGRRPTVMLGPDLTAEQRKAVKIFDLERWMPGLLSSIDLDASRPSVTPAA